MDAAVAGMTGVTGMPCNATQPLPPGAPGADSVRSGRRAVPSRRGVPSADAFADASADAFRPCAPVIVQAAPYVTDTVGACSQQKTSPSRPGG